MAIDRRCETKVRNFELEVFFKHEIFRLEVTMADTLVVHVVKSLEHLLRVEPGHWLAELTPERDEVEQLATAAKFENDVLHFFGPLLWVLLNARALLDKVDDTRMTKLLQDLELCVHQLLEVNVLAEDLDGEAISSSILCQLDLAADSRAESSSQLVLSC